jgi:hypothetical protein
MNLYVAPEIRKEVWAPIEVPRHEILYGPISKQLNQLPKPSAMHIREGHTYESRAIVLNNPLHPVEISDWGQLNNLGGASGGANTKNKVAKKVAIETRRRTFAAAYAALKASIARQIGAANPGPKPTYPGRSTGPAAEAYKRNKEAWEANEKAWKAAVKKIAANDSKAHLRPLPDKDDKFVKGNEMLPLIFQRGGYFVAPKLATLELRGHPEVYSLGKGENYIELDGLIYNKAQHRVIILELKKGKGVSGAEDAQQMRKAAALFRKWGLEITGRVPTVELYFAAGAAERFSSAKNYHFNLEKNNVQDWTPKKIQETVTSRADHIAYIRTPIFLLTGLGLSNLLRIDPKKMAQLMAATTAAYNSIGRAIKPYFLEANRTITNANMKKWALVRNGGTNATPKYRRATETEIANNEKQLFLNISGLSLSTPAIKNAIPKAWLPQPNTTVVPTMKVARVAEGILYINYLKGKINKPTTNAQKRNLMRTNLKKQIKLLLSDKYKTFLKANEQTRLRNLLASTVQNASPVRAEAASPTKNQKYYSRVLKAAAARQTTYYKSKTGTFKTRPASEVKVGYAKVNAERLLPNYLFKKGANLNFGNIVNLTPNVLRAVDDDTLARWASYISQKLEKNSGIPAPRLDVFNKLLNSIHNSRKVQVAGASVRANTKRQQLVNLTRVVKGALTNYRETVRRNAAAPVRPATAARPASAAPTRASKRPRSLSVRFANGASNNENNSPARDGRRSAR